jgi:hypothetical protein
MSHEVAARKWTPEKIAAWNAWLKTPEANGYEGGCGCNYCREIVTRFHAQYGDKPK